VLLNAATDSNVIEFPVRHGYAGRDDLYDVVFALATAVDLESVMPRLAEWLKSGFGVSKVEWWRTGDDGAPELVAEAGSAGAMRHNVPLGPAGALVLHASSFDPRLEPALLSLAPVLRRRAAEERLTRTAMQLARRNEALEDFAALVAHELKAPLQAALAADDPSGPVEEALELVEAMLQAARESSAVAFASAAECLTQAAEDLRAEVAITSDLATTLPLPAGPLRVILRNLVSNAVAAGAHHVHVTAEHSSRSFRLLVDDDGAGLVYSDRYATGSGLGFSLCRRLAGRFGGRLQLTPHPAGGARAMLEFAEARR
jgi:signal transduction histidine kinase